MNYYPFGAIQENTQTGSFDEQRKFTGHEYDDEVDLTYANARYYEQNIARWISQDPASRDNPEQFLKDPQQFNYYTYSRNNPVVMVDLNGEVAFLAIPAAGAVMKLIVGGFTAGAVVKTVESLYTNIYLPQIERREAFTAEDREKGLIRGLLVDPSLNFALRGIRPMEGQIALDTALSATKNIFVSDQTYGSSYMSPIETSGGRKVNPYSSLKEKEYNSNNASYKASNSEKSVRSNSSSISRQASIQSMQKQISSLWAKVREIQSAINSLINNN